MSNLKEYYPLHVAKKTAECTRDIVFAPEEMRHLHRVSEQGDVSYNTSKGKGSLKRPHYRKPHWSHYWYNKLDQNNEPVYNVYGVVEKVKRPKRITAVNVNEKYGESDVVIHTVKN